MAKVEQPRTAVAEEFSSKLARQLPQANAARHRFAGPHVRFTAASTLTARRGTGSGTPRVAVLGLDDSSADVGFSAGWLAADAALPGL